jgi:hypothetical protein
MGKTKRIHRESANKRSRCHVERCCECKRTWGLQNFVLGVGSYYSDIFCFPTQRAHVVMLCEECAQHHGPLEECISCVRQVIGPTLFGKCRLCLCENKIWKALENFGVADRLLHPDERGAALNGNKYSIFFDEYGKPLDEILQAIPPL